MKKQLMNLKHIIFLSITLSCLSLTAIGQMGNLPVNKYRSVGFEKHKQNTKGILLSVGYSPKTSFLNSTFVKSMKTEDLKSDGGLSAYVETSVFYPISIQLGAYSETFKLSDDFNYGSLQGSKLKINNEYIEAFICSQLFPSKSKFLPYIGIGYIDGGLKLKSIDDKRDGILSSIKMQSVAWRLGMKVYLIDDARGKIGVMVDYMQPLQIAGLFPNTSYAFNRFQVGVFAKFSSLNNLSSIN